MEKTESKKWTNFKKAIQIQGNALLLCIAEIAIYWILETYVINKIYDTAYVAVIAGGAFVIFFIASLASKHWWLSFLLPFACVFTCFILAVLHIIGFPI